MHMNRTVYFAGTTWEMYSAMIFPISDGKLPSLKEPAVLRKTQLCPPT